MYTCAHVYLSIDACSSKYRNKFVFIRLLHWTALYCTYVCVFVYIDEIYTINICIYIIGLYIYVRMRAYLFIDTDINEFVAVFVIIDLFLYEQ